MRDLWQLHQLLALLIALLIALVSCVDREKKRGKDHWLTQQGTMKARILLGFVDKFPTTLLLSLILREYMIKLFHTTMYKGKILQVDHLSDKRTQVDPLVFEHFL